LIIGVSTDPVFGPVILFGQGGIAVEVTADHALGLPPLNMVLARDMVARTRVAKLLEGYRNRPAANIDAICRTLIQVAQLVTDLADVVELDINPLLADSRGVIALDARLRIKAATSPALARLAIRPYPQEWEQWVTWQDAPLLLRPIKPEDGAQHVAFFDALDPEDVRYRMFIRQRELQPSQLARLTQIDYDREIAFIATRKGEDGAWETLGVARAVADPDNVMAEFAIIVRSDLKAHGLGRLLMTRLLDYCRQRGTQSITGQALSHNLRVLNLVKSFGFAISPAPDEPGTMLLQLDLSEP
jgi:acetyltransferase